MSYILDRLRQDHTNVLQLLNVLERQIAVLDRRERPDWDIVEGAIEYLLTYPDLRHHPLEDQILRHLQAKDPSAAEPLSGLDTEHRKQSESLRRLAAATHQVLQDVSMARQSYIDLLRSFVAAQRDHIRKEEVSFFPSAERILDAPDWVTLDRQAADMIDPLAGDPVERRFAVLRRNLDSWDIVDRGQRQPD
jgi:hemerythrin-like domain-containing protein